MKFGSVPASEAAGGILAHAVRVNGTVFKKGRQLSTADVDMLLSHNVAKVVVACLEEGDVHEDVAARRIAVLLAGGHVQAQQAYTGRSNLHSTADGLVEVDHVRVNAINQLHESLTLATLAPFSVVLAKQLLATVKVIPFAVPEQVLVQAEKIIGAEPLLRVRPWCKKRIGLVLTEVEGGKVSLVEKAVQAISERLQVFGLQLHVVVRVLHEQAAVAGALAELKKLNCDLMLVFGATAIVDRLDVIPAGLAQAGGEVVHLGMPVDPGNLLMLGRLDDVTVIGVPSCARSPRRNGFDWVLERALAGLTLTKEDVMAMGVGGLLAEIASRPAPRESGASRQNKITAIVLAAGAGSRMGQGKMLVPFHGKPMLQRSLENILASQVDDVVVVTGHQRGEVSALLKQFESVTEVHNPNYAEGLASSLRVGVRAAQAAKAVVICLGDMPLVGPKLIDQLIAAFDPTENRTAVVPVFNGKMGNPVLWGSAHFAELMTLSGDQGARKLLLEMKGQAAEIIADDASVLLDADTPTDLEALKAAANS